MAHNHSGSHGSRFKNLVETPQLRQKPCESSGWISHLKNRFKTESAMYLRRNRSIDNAYWA